MIVASLLLILVAVTLLVLGLVGGSSALLVGSIVASLLAAVALVVGARQAATARSAGAEPGTTAGGWRERDTTVAATESDRSAWYGSDQLPPTADEPVDAGRRVALDDPPASVDTASVDTAGADTADEDPPDEPAAEETSEVDAALVARIDAEVVVVDGRPRYHRAVCVHLLARQGEALPVREAIELGFTPCSLCEPNSVLLAESGRV
ncbi:hypothetical protein ACN27F_30400 [Solwaraspora sp. WMMB335]|uniref:hypothetical protein n=1 Tax=Solwaraspora sp. WMMB335 TaxID=3404118 RepID=UPI003B92B141